MAEKSTIEWTDATWNPITGCSLVSPGCKNCYAMTLAGGRLKNHWSREGLTKPTPRGPVWNGKVQFNDEWLTQPLHWKKPRMIFTCAHSDLFHKSVPDRWIDKIFAVMALAPQHTFQVLTKRPERMLKYLSHTVPTTERFLTSPKRRDFVICDTIRSDQLNGRLPGMGLNEAPWPLPNVWLGVSVEDQKRTYERIPVLLGTPAAVRFVSVEPLLGPINLTPYLTRMVVRSNEELTDAMVDKGFSFEGGQGDHQGLDWCITGGESGLNARPMHSDWARSIRDQCVNVGVPFFFKQWGEWAPEAIAFLGSWKGQHETYKWSDAGAVRFGKKKAGRILDGRTWDEMPK